MSIIRHLVLDNAAVSALLSTKKNDPARKAVVTAIGAANGSRWVPTAVRVEAGWRRTAPTAGGANRLMPPTTDASLDTDAADRATALRSAVSAASVVDATVAVVAERAGAAGNVVEILTSDEPDLKALTSHLTTTAKVHVKKL